MNSNAVKMQVQVQMQVRGDYCGVEGNYRRRGDEIRKNKKGCEEYKHTHTHRSSGGLAPVSVAGLPGDVRHLEVCGSATRQ